MFLATQRHTVYQIGINGKNDVVNLTPLTMMATGE
jgi:hypothetical protein